MSNSFNGPSENEKLLPWSYLDPAAAAAVAAAAALAAAADAASAATATVVTTPIRGRSQRWKQHKERQVRAPDA